jgi:hypothetical protein
VLFAAVAVAGGCEPAGRAGGEPEFTIGNPPYSPTRCTGAPERWELGDQPVATVDPAEHELYWITDALFWQDSLIALAHQSGGEVLFFMLDGELVRRFGRRGGGPGEYRAITQLVRYRADSLAAFDVRLRRATVMDGNGELGRLVPIGQQHPRVDVLLGSGPEGSLYFEAEWQGFEGWLTRDTLRVLRVAEGDDAELLVSLPHTYSYQVRVQGSPSIGNPPLTPVAYADLQGRHLVAGQSDWTALYHLDVVSGIARWFSVPCRLAPVSEQDIRGYQDQLLQNASPDGEARYRELWSQLEYPDWIPWFKRLLVDRTGHVWLGEYTGRGLDPSRWLVVDLEGRIVARVSTPERFWPMDIGEDYVLGVERDSLDLEWVRMYPLRRSGGV